MNTLRQLFLFALVSFFILPTTVEGKRDMLSGYYSRKMVYESLARNSEWVKYPSYYDRASWAQIPEEIRKTTIAEGEKYIGYKWPIVTASMYLEFTRNGDRSVVDNLNSQRSRALQTLTIAELMEGKGRFIDDIINGVFAFCEQTYWGSSAHFYLYGFDGSIANPLKSVPDIEDPVIDLVVGDMGANLSWIWYFFNKEFDKVSPIISNRLKDEIKKKVLEPFYSRYDFWWITGWDAGNVNNWNPWCNYNMLTCIMLIEDDRAKKETGIYKTMESVDLFINSYPEDGGCDEGPSYWGVAGGKLFDYLDLLKTVTAGKIDIFSNELIKNMGRYIYRVYISKGNYYINFADAPFKIGHDASRILRYGKSIEDPVLEGFGAYLMKESGFGTKPVVGKIGETMETLFNSQSWNVAKPNEPLPGQYYFPNLDIALGRDKEGTTDGFYFSAKGGSNGEGHNHNDVGSFMLYYNGDPVLIDVGVGAYTRETFSDQRYTIWTMQSNYHNLPVINGLGQSPGGNFKAFDRKFNATQNRVSYSSNIAKAYEPEAKVDSWVRSYVLERGKKFTINDNFKLIENKGETSFHFMTTLPCKIKSPGVIEFQGDNFVLQMKYNSSLLKADIETVTVEDQRLINSLGGKVFRVALKYTGNSLNGNVSFDISAVK